MRVLHVATPSSYGGLEQVLVSLATAQRALGDEVHVATLTTATGSQHLLDRLERHEVVTHPGTATGRDYRRQRLEIDALGRGLRPDIVHTHGYHADVLLSDAGHHNGAAMVTTLHGFTGGDLKNRCYEWLQRRAIRNCDGVVTVSASMAEQIARAGIPADRVHVIPNVLPPPGPRLFRAAARRSLGLPSDAWLVGWVGRLSHEKGLDLLIDALTIERDRLVHIAVVGDGPERQRLERQARSLGVGDRITWCGAVPDAHRFFPAFDLLVMSSRTEGSPIVLLEAMSACIPIVATAVGGVPETVTPSTALLVPPEDPVALAEGMQAVRRDPGRAARRSLRAHVQSARVSDPSRWAASYATAYRAALAHRSDRM